MHPIDLGVREGSSMSRIPLHVHVLAGAAVYGILAVVELPPIPRGLVTSGALHLVALPPIPGGLLTSGALHRGRHHWPSSLVGVWWWFVGWVVRWVVGWLLSACRTALPIWQIQCR